MDLNSKNIAKNKPSFFKKKTEEDFHEQLD